MSILFIDNRDSFVWNLVDFVSIFNSDTILVPNTVTIDEIVAINPDAIIISPGPGTPEKRQDIGNCIEVIRMIGKTTPILGVCLGHQAIAVAFGGSIGHSKSGPMHGKTSLITHNDPNLFKGISNPLRVGRYHSLEIKNNPKCLKVIAQTEDDIIMGVKHSEYPIYGLQFHPESIITDEGLNIIENFLIISTNCKYNKEKLKMKNNYLIIYFMGKFEIEHIQKQGGYLRAPSKKRWYIVWEDIYKENIYEEDNWSNKERKNGLNWHIGILYFLKYEYLFGWDNIPGDDDGRLIEFLTQKFDIDWVKIAEIEKIDDGRTIRLIGKNNFLSLKLNNEKTKIILEINDNRTYEFIAKIENGKLYKYKYENITIEFRCYKCKSVLSEKQTSENNKKLKESDIPIICKKCNVWID